MRRVWEWRELGSVNKLGGRAQGGQDGELKLWRGRKLFKSLERDGGNEGVERRGSWPWSAWDGDSND